MLCLSVTANSVTKAIATVARHTQYIDAFELRVDYLTRCDAAQIVAIPQQIATTCGITESILTIRRTADGGRYTYSNEQRLQLMLDIICMCKGAQPFTHIDLETDIQAYAIHHEIVEEANRQHIKIIRSIHANHPAAHSLERLLHEVRSAPDEIGKIAINAQGIGDVYDIMAQLHGVLKSQRDPARPLIFIIMGAYGFFTRVLANKYGFYGTYCSERGAMDADLGHATPQQMHTRYRYHTINRHTKVFGIIGNPIAHSISPRIHNQNFAQQEHNAVYIPFLCDNVSLFFQLARIIPMHGFSITIPHKETALACIDTIDAETKNIGACNTVLYWRHAWHGFNSDRYGFFHPLHALLDKKAQHKISTAVIIGAGGAARAAASVLLEHNFSLCILNRTESRRNKFVADLQSQFPHASLIAQALDKSSLPAMERSSALIVQTTSVGMHPHAAATPIPFYQFKGHEIVYDMIYTPEQTTLLKEAERAGCTTIGGMHMLNAQATEQYRYFKRVLH